jgi:hypothetical protein
MAVYGGWASCLERGGQELQELSHLSEFHALCPGLWLYTDDGLLVFLVWREEGRNFWNCLTLVSYMLCVQDCGSIQRTGFLFGERKMGT